MGVAEVVAVDLEQGVGAILVWFFFFHPGALLRLEVLPIGYICPAPVKEGDYQNFYIGINRTYYC